MGITKKRPVCGRGRGGESRGEGEAKSRTCTHLQEEEEEDKHSSFVLDCRYLSVQLWPLFVRVV